MVFGIGDPVYAVFGEKTTLGTVRGFDEDGTISVGFSAGDGVVIAQYYPVELKRPGRAASCVTFEDVKRLGLADQDPVEVVSTLRGPVSGYFCKDKTDALWFHMYGDGIAVGRLAPDNYPYEELVAVNVLRRGKSTLHVDDLGRAEAEAGCDIAPSGIDVASRDFLGSPQVGDGLRKVAGFKW